MFCSTLELTTAKIKIAYGKTKMHCHKLVGRWNGLKSSSCLYILQQLILVSFRSLDEYSVTQNYSLTTS